MFSTLLNPHSAIGDVLMNVQDNFIFFATELLKDELHRYVPKIAAYSKLKQEQLSELQIFILSTITFVSEELISESSWIKAFDLTKDIDEDDTPFVALALELKTKLWTGDKVLSKGLISKGSDIAITIKELKGINKIRFLYQTEKPA